MRRLTCSALLFFFCLAAAASAEDHYIAGDLIRLGDPGLPQNRRVLFRAAKDAAIVPSLSNDPRVLGATVEITGNNPGDGSTGVLTLAPEKWFALGNPAGSKGFRYLDTTNPNGIRRVGFRPGLPGRGGLLAIRGFGMNWPYLVTQPQGSVVVRFTIGTERYCAQFQSALQNRSGLYIARNATAPSTCDIPVSNCGNAVVEGGEECDDGGTMDGDGCSATCQLEDASALCEGIPTTSGTAIQAVRVAQGLTLPNTITAPRLDPNRVFVVEKIGVIRIIQNGVLLPTPFLDINSRVIATGINSEQGLLGLAFHPDFENNKRFFVNYTNNAGDSVIARYEVTGSDPNVADFNSERILLTIDDFAGNHNGGDLQFGPDGYLYFGNGDGGGGGDPNETGQDDGSLFGKMLRFDVDVEAAPYYAVPPSNPNAGAGLPLGLIWAKGLRNPWRYSFDRLTGDLYIADVGQGSWEEIDWVSASSTGGENYGWDIFEGNHCFEPDPAPMCPSMAGFVSPVYEYNHSSGTPTGCSVTGGYVYRGCAMPDLHGTYFFSDYCNPFIRTFQISGGVAVNHQDRTAELDPPGSVDITDIVSYGEDARGEIYISDQNGEIFKIVPQ